MAPTLLFYCREGVQWGGERVAFQLKALTVRMLRLWKLALNLAHSPLCTCECFQACVPSTAPGAGAMQRGVWSDWLVSWTSSLLGKSLSDYRSQKPVYIGITGGLIKNAHSLKPR